MPFGQLHRPDPAPSSAPARPGAAGGLKGHQKQAAAGAAVLAVVVLALRHKKSGGAPVDTASAGQVAYPGSTSADTAGGGGYGGYSGPTGGLPGAGGPTDASTGTGAPAPVINVTVNNGGTNLAHPPVKRPVPGAPGKKPAAPVRKPTAAEVKRHQDQARTIAKHRAAAAAAAKKGTAAKLPGAHGPRR